MPNQSKIITKVNNVLNQLPHIEFEFNRGGVCAGLASLFIKYELMGKREEFFQKLTYLSQMPKDYKFGKNKYGESFIAEIENVFSPSDYNKSGVIQGELEKLLYIQGEPLRNEFNVGMVTDEQKWVTIFEQIARDNRAYYLGSQNHAIALSIKNGKYILFDPNYDETFTKEFQTPQELVKEIKSCFGYKENVFPLRIRGFANPFDKTCKDYPTDYVLQREVFQQESDKFQVFTHNSAEYTSTFFACKARDEQTLNYLFETKGIKFGKLSALERTYPHFIALLLKQPSSEEIQLELLYTITVNIASGTNLSAIQDLIYHYNNQYNSQTDQKRLQTILQQALEIISVDFLKKMDLKCDYTDILYFYEHYKLDSDHRTEKNYTFFKLITLFNKDPEQAKEFISTFTADQLHNQIGLTAALNQVPLLNQLLDAHTTITSKTNSTSIFSEELIKNISSINLKRLIQNIIQVEPTLLAKCMDRKDKDIFKQYFAAVLIQENKQFLLDHMKDHFKKPQDLGLPIGNINLLTALVFLDETKAIKRHWNNDIDTNTIEAALILSIKAGNEPLTIFLHGKLLEKESKLNPKSIEELVQYAIAKENNTILSLLARLKYNILTKATLSKIININGMNEDYTPLQQSFALADKSTKTELIRLGILTSSAPIIQICMENDPQLMSNILKGRLDKKGYIVLFAIDKHFNLPEMEHLQEQLKQYIQTNDAFPIIQYCYTHHLFELTKEWAPLIKWSDERLNLMLTELIKSKNEEALSHLLKLHPNLKDANLLHELINHKLLNLIAETYKSIHLTQEQFNQLIEEGIANNKPIILKALLTKNMPIDNLTALLKDAIDKDHVEILEFFSTTEHDFGINFKELFFYCCDKDKPEIANHLLAKPIEWSQDKQLAKEETHKLLQLLHNKNSSTIYKELYQKGYGNLLVRFMESKIQNLNNPKAELVREMHAKVSMTLFEETIKNKNPGGLLNTYAQQTTFPEQVDLDVLKLINDNPSAQLLKFFEVKYGWVNLLFAALDFQEMDLVSALILERHSLDILQDIKGVSPFIPVYIKHLKVLSEKEDVRSRLFKLIDPATDSGLKQTAEPYKALIHQELAAIELKMLEEGRDLNGKIYRYSFSNDAFKNALSDINLAFQNIAAHVQHLDIDLRQRIESNVLNENFATIKGLMAKHDIMPHYLNNEQQKLWQQLTETPTFKEVCQWEFKIYNLIKELNLLNKPRVRLPETKQKQLDEAIDALRLAVTNNNLPATFILPEINKLMLPVSIAVRVCLNLKNKVTNEMMMEMIKEEIKEILSEIWPTLSESQRSSIFDQEDLLEKIEGSAHSGLTQIYFNSIPWSPVKEIQSNTGFFGFISNFSSVPDDDLEEPSSKISLKGTKEDRKAQIIMHINNTLDEYASMKIGYK